MTNDVLPSDYLPSDRLQSASDNYALFLLEKVLGRAPSDEDRALFSGCKTVEDIMHRICNSHVFMAFIRGTNDGTGRLGEFYTALRCGKEWAPRKGFDVWGSWEYHEHIKTGKIEVKTCIPTHLSCWQPRVKGYKPVIVADVVVIICLVDTWNPCDARLFAIPKSDLDSEVEAQRARRTTDPRTQISINKSPINGHTGRPSRWYEFEVVNHTRLKETLTQFIHGDFELAPEQLSLFDFHLGENQNV